MRGPYSPDVAATQCGGRVDARAGARRASQMRVTVYRWRVPGLRASGALHLPLLLPVAFFLQKPLETSERTGR
jgi:hypothetical protein